MDENTVLGLLIRQIGEDKAVAEATLCGGRCSDYATYRELCGKIYGLSLAQMHVEEMVARLREQND